jgi:hypothetical protein
MAFGHVDQNGIGQSRSGVELSEFLAKAIGVGSYHRVDRTIEIRWSAEHRGCNALLREHVFLTVYGLRHNETEKGLQNRRRAETGGSQYAAELFVYFVPLELC